MHFCLAFVHFVPSLYHSARVSNPSAQRALDTALDLRALGRFDESERFCRQALELDPHNHESLHLLGWLLHQRTEPAQAVELIRAAIAIERNFAPYHNSLSLALKDAARIDDAIGAARRAIELEP